MDELVDNVVSLDNINQVFHRQFTDIDLTNEEIVISAFYKALNYLHVGGDAHFIQWMYSKLLVSASTQASIADIIITSGYSQRRVEQKFKTLIGLKAKQLQRILKLRQLMDDLSKPGYSINLGTLAYRYGYYDQSHFIKSYQRINLDAPSQFNVGEYLLPLSGHFDFLQL